MPSLEEVIDAQELELRCPHCTHVNVCGLGWVRVHPERVCSECEGIIVLGTSQILGDIRHITRVFRELDTSLHKDLHCWGEGGPTPPTTSSQRLEPIMRGLGLVHGLLDDGQSSPDSVQARSDAKSARALYVTLKPLAEALLDASGNLPELREALASIDKRLRTVASG